MKKLLSGATVLALVLSPVLHGQNAAVQDKALQAAIAARRHAIDTGNGDEWAKYTTDDFVTVLPDGSMVDKAATKVQHSTPGGAPPTVESARRYGSDTAVLVQLTGADAQGRRTRVTVVWVRMNGAWKVASSHQTYVADKSSAR